MTLSADVDRVTFDTYQPNILFPSVLFLSVQLPQHTNLLEWFRVYLF